jgi:glycosyltransferase involved in cell wall biosynthesis
MRDRIVAKGVSPAKVAVIPPWCQDQQVRFDAEGRVSFRSAHGLAGKYVIMYSGNHSPVHPLDTLMQAADQLDSDTNIVFCFIGGGSGFSRIKKWALNKPNVLCLPYQPLNRLSASLSAADAQVVVMGDRMRGLVHPCKIYNILTVGAPVIYLGPELSHVTEILAGLKPPHPWVGVRHGAGGELVKQIHRLRRQTLVHDHPAPAEIEARFSRAALLPLLLTLIESKRGVIASECAPPASGNAPIAEPLAMARSRLP